MEFSKSPWLLMTICVGTIIRCTNLLALNDTKKKQKGSVEKSRALII